MRESIGPRTALVGLLLLMAVLAGRLALVYHEFGATIDEGRHVAAGVEVYDTGEFSIYPHSPPLPRWVNGLAPYLGGAHLPSGADDPELVRLAAKVDREHSLGKYVLEAGDYWQTLILARIGTLAFLALLMFYVYRWSALLYGRLAGLAAATLITFSPNIIAHGSMATVDVAFAATFVAATFYLWRWIAEPGPRTWLAFVLAMTGALLCKFPAPMFLVFVAGAFILMSWRHVLEQLRSVNGSLLRIGVSRVAVLLFVMFFITWAAYQFSLGTAADAASFPWVDDLLGRRFPDPAGSSLDSWAHWLAKELVIPVPQLINAGYILYREGTRIWPAYLLGEMSDRGFLLFFPVALMVKSTPGLLLMALAGVANVFAHRKQTWAKLSMYLLVAGSVFLLLLIVKRMNIGVRHALPVYPFAAILASSLFGRQLVGVARRVLPVFGAVLLLWHAGESIASHPNYLAYFNQIARGREHEFLLDSNLDWGQDLARLGRYCKEHAIEDITLSVFGATYGTSPGVFGMTKAVLLASDERPTGWFAVSRNHLMGVGLGPPVYEALDGFAWLPPTPHAQIGSSILLYRLP